MRNYFIPLKKKNNYKANSVFKTFRKCEELFANFSKNICKKIIKKLEVGPDFTQNSFCVSLTVVVPVSYSVKQIFHRKCAITLFLFVLALLHVLATDMLPPNVTLSHFDFSQDGVKEIHCACQVLQKHFILQLKAFNHIVDTYCKGIYIYSLFLNVLINYF